jgi:hypothetical protein
MAKDKEVMPKDDDVYTVQQYLDYIYDYIEFYYYNKSSVYNTTIEGQDVVVDCEWLYTHSGSVGTSDYNALNNKPSINNVTLEGNKQPIDLGLASRNELFAFETEVDDHFTADEATVTALAAVVDTKADIYWRPATIELKEVMVGFGTTPTILDFSGITDVSITQMVPEYGINISRGEQSDGMDAQYLTYWWRQGDPGNVVSLVIGGYLDYYGDNVLFGGTRVLSCNTDTKVVTWDTAFLAAHSDKKIEIDSFVDYPDAQTITIAYVNGAPLPSSGKKSGRKIPGVRAPRGDSTLVGEVIMFTTVPKDGTKVDCLFNYDTTEALNASLVSAFTGLQQINILLDTVIPGFTEALNDLVGRVAALEAKVPDAPAGVTEPYVLTVDQEQT